MKPSLAPREGVSGGLPTVLALAGLVLAVETIGRFDISLFLPTFSAVARVWLRLVREGVLPRAVETSLTSLAVGFGSAALAGIVLGLALGRYRLAGRVLDPYINFMMSAPLAAFVPVLIAIFGVSGRVVTITVFLFSFFIVLVNTRTGLEGTPRSLVEMARSYGAGDLALFRYIYLPAALPAIMVGLQLGAVNAVKGLVVGEMMLALLGLGQLLVQYANVFLITHLYASS